MAATVGHAYVTILPSARGFRRNLEAQIGGDLRAAGRSGGQSYGHALIRAVAPSVDRTSDTIRSGLTGAAADAGRAFVSLGSFGVSAGARIAASLGRVSAYVLPVLVAAIPLAIGAFGALASAASVAAGAIGAAFAGIGIGLTIAAQTERGQKALEEFKKAAKTILQDAAKPMVPAFEGALTQVEGLLRSIKPTMRETFTSLAGVVERAMPRIREAITRVAPVFGELAEAGGAFIDSFTKGLPGVASKLAPALAKVMPEIKEFARWLGKHLAGFLERVLPDIIRLAEDGLPLLKAAIKTTTGAIETFVNIATGVINFLQRLGVWLRTAHVGWLKFRVGVLKALDALPGFNTQAQIAAAKTDLLAAKEGLAAAKAEIMSDKLERLSGDLGSTAADALKAARDFDQLSGAARDVPARVYTEVASNAVAALGEINAVDSAVRSIPSHKSVYIDVAASIGAAAARALRFQTGGFVSGPRYPADQIPAQLTGGEFVMSQAAVSTWGRDLFEALNRGVTPSASASASAAPAAGGGGPGPGPLIGNYTQHFHGGTSAAEVVNKTLFELRRIRVGSGW